MEAIAVGAVMAVHAWPPGTERHRTLARPVKVFNAKLPAFLHPPRQPKRQEVSLEA